MMKLNINGLFSAAEYFGAFLTADEIALES